MESCLSASNSNIQTAEGTTSDVLTNHGENGCGDCINKPTNDDVIIEGAEGHDPNKNSDDVDSSEPVIDININNVVCAFSLRCHLNLKEIARTGKHVEYRKENSMLNMKLRNPHCTASIWSSGKVTITGATSEKMAYQSARCIARSIQKMGFQVKFCNYRVVNVLATCCFPFGINIREFSDNHRPQASYEPELHPAVTYRIATPKATLKIFSTGSITVTGASVTIVQSAIEHIYPLVVEFKTAYDPRPEYGKYRELYRTLKRPRQRYRYDSGDDDDDDFDDDVDELDVMCDLHDEELASEHSEDN